MARRKETACPSIAAGRSFHPWPRPTGFRRRRDRSRTRSTSRRANTLAEASNAMPGRDRLGFATTDAHGIKVAQQIEDDRLAVGRNIERDPCSFVSRELDRPVRFQRQGRWLLLGLFFLLLVFRLLLLFLLLFVLVFLLRDRSDRVASSAKTDEPAATVNTSKARAPRAATSNARFMLRKPFFGGIAPMCLRRSTPKAA